MNMILLTVVDYLITDTCYYFIIPMREWTYSFICYLFTYVIFVYHLNYCFLMFSEICKEYREHLILHQTSENSFIRMIDVAGFVNQSLFIWFLWFVVVQLLILCTSRFVASEENSNIEFH